MSGRGQPPERVPTLTEVLEPPPGSADRLLMQDGDASPVPLPVAEPAVPVVLPPDAVHDEAVARRVLADVQAHIDRVLDARVRSALAPALEALTLQVIADARRELASTLRDGLARALAQEAARHRADPGPR